MGFFNTTVESFKDFMHFSSRMLIQTLEKLIDKYKDCEQPSIWLCCVPLYHLVTKKIQKPFDKLQLAKNHSAEIPRWWGINDIEGAFNALKRKKWYVQLGNQI